ncbi:MAG: hypothetical protein DWP92_10150 [Armatimonadetes bacterium]|nr:MAG: hypothetical protein DWP92_10150 [Armatimonadota bacterium]
MRNVFDQYQQPENRLTHAVVSTLDADRRLLRPFLRSLGFTSVPLAARLQLVEQQLPGEIESGLDEERGLPDACAYDDDGFAALIESKVQASVRVGQLRRHLKTAEHHGYPGAQLVVISVDEPKVALPQGVRHVHWKDVYCWFARRTDSSWARRLREYMEVFEARMIARDYAIRGTLTMFNGLRFDDDHPYTYAEGKRLLRLLGDELRGRADLKKLGVDPEGKGRSAITGRGEGRVWDHLALREARRAKMLTDHPHVTLSIGRDSADVGVTVPNGIRGGFRTRLATLGPDRFAEFITTLEKSLRPAVDSSRDAKPLIYVLQRHYRTQRSIPDEDARLTVDLGTAVRGSRRGVKYQPEWFDTIYSVLVHKRSNLQLGAHVRFSYACPKVRSRKAVDLFARAAIGLKPMLDLALGRF